MRAVVLALAMGCVGLLGGGAEGLTFKSEHADTSKCEVRTRGIFAVWWDKRYDYGKDAEWILEMMEEVRHDEMVAKRMRNPPNVDQGHYFNVYVHRKGDVFPDGWAQGVGTDRNRLPYLTFPGRPDLLSLKHETFHVFQYAGDSPGFAYRGDSGWYIEGAANWYAAVSTPGDRRAFLEGAAVAALPHLPIWHSGYFNREASEPGNWQRYVHQYGMSTLLYYVTEVGGADRGLLVDGLYAGTALTPQEWLYRKVAGFRGLFADWAAHMTGGMDFMTAEQAARAEQELGNHGDAADLHPFVATYTDAGSGGWVRPGTGTVTRGWGYNVFRVKTTKAATYTFRLEGDGAGSEGTPARFEGRVVVRHGGGAGHAYHKLGAGGEVTVAAAGSDTDVFFVVAAVPEKFGSNERYSYRVRIERGTQAPPPPSPTPPRETPAPNEATCTDLELGGKAWYDAGGSRYTCAWYASQPHYCRTFGAGYRRTHTANEACCTCGGGRRRTTACVDKRLRDGSLWHDAGGEMYSCAWYEQDARYCQLYGDKYRNQHTANEACCFCQK